MVPTKSLRKPAPRNAAPAGTPERRGHRARLAPPAPDTNATHPMSSPTSVAIHDPRDEDQSFRTYLRLPSYSESEEVTECALQLRKMGDKLNLRQRILNLIAKLFCPGAQECLE
ncbi:UNVERIFIED_CONTAM: hypothetical protein K2H54_066227 [Gekko kuhli]